ncbi:zinc finger protein 862-like [Ptychodera flava]|uniref:zinc finger protein 862-like n=1 Tax=Ptychodera flava TaxID=63121 RepID=UPI003969D8A0
MSDGSTDVSVVENEVVYVHFATGGVTHCNFLGMVACESGNAQGIYTAIQKALIFPNITQDEIMKKVVGFIGDGASVNTGHVNGVISIFQRNVNQSIIILKCMSHRVELAFKDAMKTSSHFKQVYDLLDQLFKFFHKSPKQTGGLKEAFQALDKQVIMPTRVGGTRWIGHTQRALQNMIKAYPALMRHLSQVATTRTQFAAQPKAKFLMGKLRSRTVLLFAHFVNDIPAVIVKLSMFLQQRQTCIYQVHEQLKATAKHIKKFENRSGPEQRKLQASLDSNDGVFEGERLTGSQSSTEIDNNVSKVVQGLVKALETRFQDTDKGVLECTKLADVTSWPATYDDAIDFGDHLLAAFIDHYHHNLSEAGIDVSAAELEWTSLKQALYNTDSFNIHSMTWQTINRLFHTQYPNVLGLVDLILSLPAGTSECERGFSQMKVTKTSYRNKLKSTTMSMLMTIQLHSPSVSSFNPMPAIQQWNHHHLRKPNFMDVRHRKKLNVIMADSNEAVEAEDDAQHASDMPVEQGAEAEGDTQSFEAGQGLDSNYESDFSDLLESDVGSDTDLM